MGISGGKGGDWDNDVAAVDGDDRIVSMLDVLRG